MLPKGLDVVGGSQKQPQLPLLRLPLGRHDTAIFGDLGKITRPNLSTNRGTTINGSRLHGIQLWLALPPQDEEVDPGFVHYPAKDIPVIRDFGPIVTVIMGEAYGIRSPVVTLSPTLYVEAVFSEAGQLALPGGYTERAVYVVEGEVFIEGCALTPGNMAVIRAGAVVSIQSDLAARVMIIGGEPFPEKRNIWWNFVTTSPERIEEAKLQWGEERFQQVPGETEFIPLPD